MFTKHQEDSLSWMQKCYRFMYRVPVCWDPQLKRISTNKGRVTWFLWYLGNTFVFSLWLSCVYTLITQFYMHRENFGHLHFCILTTGFCCFSATLLSAHGVRTLRYQQGYLDAINQYIQLEEKIFLKYHARILRKDRHMTLYDIFFVICRPAIFITFLIFLVCMVWDVDGPYWVLEDFGSNPMYRSLKTIIWYKAIRVFFLFPGFLETGRTLYYTCLGYMTVMLTLREMITVLKSKVNNSQDFFQYNDQFSIICNILADGAARVGFYAVTITYFLFVQSMWMCICGFEYLEPTVYLFFASSGFLIIVAVLLGLPMCSVVGENIADLPKVKRVKMQRRYCAIKSVKNGLNVKKAKALKPIRFTYGNYFSFGRSFARNLLNSMIQNLLTMILLFDIYGKRHK